MCVSSTDTKKKSLKSNIHNIIRRWKLILKRISEEALNNLDENNSTIADDKRVEALFVNSNDNNYSDTGTDTDTDNMEKRRNKEKHKDIRSLNNGELSNFNNYRSLSKHSVSTSSIIKEKDNERKVTDFNSNFHNTENIDGYYNNIIIINSNSNSNSYDRHKITFDNYDPVEECKKLRSQINGTFYHAGTIWETRRKLWTENITNIDSSKEHNRGVFKSIPEQYYYRVYKKLVIDDKPLREPLNLEDAIKVINSRWMETKTWDNVSKGLG